MAIVITLCFVCAVLNWRIVKAEKAMDEINKK
jgi:hypothetical protein